MTDPQITLTPQQVHDLRQLADWLRDTKGDITDNDVWFDRYVGLYLARLALDAGTEKVPLRHADHEISRNVTPALRLATLAMLQKSLGRKLTPEDILDRLKTVGPIDDAVANAVSSDIERLKCEGRGCR